MLNQMRRGASGWVAKLFLGGLAVSFVGWGIADVLRAPGGGSTVLQAGDVRVSLSEYEMAYRQGLNRLGQQLQARPTAEQAEMFGVDQMVLAQLRSGAMVDLKAENAGLGVSDAGLIALIQREPAFHDGSGHFSRDVMRAVLANAGMNEANYLADLRRSAVRGQLIGSVTDDVAVPRAFVDALGAYNGERRTVQYVVLQPQPADGLADPSDEELGSYFTEHNDTYRAPEYRAFSYVALTPASMSEADKVTDEELTRYYEANRAQFTTPERRGVQQVVFADRASADSAAQALAGGATLADAAKGAGREIADLGVIDRAALGNASLAEAAFAAQPNTPTGVIEGPFGPVILNVTSVQPEVVRPFDDVREEIRAGLAKDAANTRITNAYNALTDALQSGAPMSEAAEQAGVKVETAPAVSREGATPAGANVDSIPGRDQVLAAVFAAEEGGDIPPVQFDGNSYVFPVLGEITPARDRPLDEVRDRVVADWKQDEAVQMVVDRGQSLAERVRKGQSFQDMAEVEGLTPETAPGLTRATAVPALGEAGMRAAFSGPQGLVASTPARDSGQALVLQVSEVAAPADPASVVADNTRSGLGQALRGDFEQGYIAALQSGVPVTYNQKAIQQAKASVR
ncbi:hypothetical protein M673_11220 [Aureimonas sp. AU20]|nr:hypothetical protein M673_11220 [Aureimonas sp. AU20]